MPDRKWQRSPEEVQQALVIQMQAIASSCASYDDGNVWEAQRLASAVHILVHDSGRTKSVLTQLGIRGTMRFMCSGNIINPDFDLSPQISLAMQAVQIHPGKGFAVRSDGAPDGQWLALLGDGATRSRFVQFHRWWDEEQIFRDRDGSFLTRKRLIFSIRNQDGGAHLDVEVSDPTYVAFSRDPRRKSSFHLTYEGKDVDIPDAHLASMRQIAWEVQQALAAVALAAF